MPYDKIGYARLQRARLPAFRPVGDEALNEVAQRDRACRCGFIVGHAPRRYSNTIAGLPPSSQCLRAWKISYLRTASAVDKFTASCAARAK